MARMTLGCTSAISRCRYWAHCARSAACGSRPVRRAALDHVAQVGAPCAPAPPRLAPTALSMLSSKARAVPQRAGPDGLRPPSGGSPTTSQSPWTRAGGAEVACLRPAHRPQAWQAAAVSARAAQSRRRNSSSAHAADVTAVGAAGTARTGQALVAALGAMARGGAGGAAAVAVRCPPAQFQAGHRAAQAVPGSQTRTPISSSMARWRSSRFKAMGGRISVSIQAQAHDHGVFALAVAGRVVGLALAHAAIAVGLVDLQGAHIAHAHLQPQPLGTPGPAPTGSAHPA